jgi:hypothetical protein
LIGAINEHDHIRVLFQAARLAQVREPRDPVGALLHRAGELGEREFGPQAPQLT